MDAKINIDLLRYAAQKWVSDYDKEAESGQGGQVALAELCGVDRSSVSKFVNGGGCRQSNARKMSYALELSPVVRNDPFILFAESLELVAKIARLPLPDRARLLRIEREIGSLIEDFPVFRNGVQENMERSADK